MGYLQDIKRQNPFHQNPRAPTTAHTSHIDSHHIKHHTSSSYSFKHRISQLHHRAVQSSSKFTMNFLFLSASFIGAEAFTPSTNPVRLSSTALNNYARTKWNPSSAASSSTSNFSPFSSFPASSGAATATSSSVPYDEIRAELKSMMDVSVHFESSYFCNVSLS